MALVRWNFFP